MTPISETDLISSIDKLFLQLEDPTARDRVLKWAWEKFSTKPIPELGKETISKKAQPPKIRKIKSASKSKIIYSFVKDLNLKPSDKQSLKDFISGKKPSSNKEKCTCVVYYLQNVLGIENISANHVFTCYKNMQWRLLNITQLLRDIASRKGWLDTSNIDSLKTTAQGDNLVEFDLPHKSVEK